MNQEGIKLMDASTLNPRGNQPSLRVSISTRLILALSYIIPAFGGVWSSLFLMGVMHNLKFAETAGVSAVMAGMAEAAIPVTVSLYLAIICGFVVIIILVIRMLMQTRTASPPSWFLIISGILCLLPAGLFCEAESQIIEVIIGPANSAGISGVASNISWLLTLSIVEALIIFLLLIVASVLPLSSRAKPKWGSLIVAVMIEILFISAAIAFQMRILWLYQVAMSN